MKKIVAVVLCLITAAGISYSSLHAAAPVEQEATAQATIRIGVINFRHVVEHSKLGKQEQEQFDAMRRQVEAIMEEKEKRIQEMTVKFNNPDYLDSLSPDAEAEAKKEYRNLSQEMSQLQNQYYQTLQQANVKIIQKLSEAISQAAEAVAKDKKLDIVVSEDATFFYQQTLNITEDVVKSLDGLLANNQLKEGGSKDVLKEMTPPATK